MRVLIAGGGTGGHLFPGLALADALVCAQPDLTVAFAGTERGIEHRVIPTTPYRLYTLPVLGVIGVGLIRRLFALAVLPAALWTALRILREFKPDLVVGVGGYASAPMLFTAGVTGTPRVLLEQNALPGSTNRIFGPSVERVFLSFDEARSHFSHGDQPDKDNFAVLGNPVRADLLTGDSTTTNNDKHPHLLVFGGSQGAHAINEAVQEAVPRLLEALPTLTITHQTGEADQWDIQKAYKETDGRATAVAFINNMGDAYRAADLVLCRAGATSVAELTALGKPSLLVPYPHAAHDHQTANAQAVHEAGAGVLITQTELTPDTIVQQVTTLLSDDKQLAQMAQAATALGRPHAAQQIAAACIDMITASQPAKDV